MSGTNTSLQLINIVNGKYSVCQNAIKQLENIDEHIAVVAVAGAYRTGKSFLLNELVRNIKSYSTSTTKGVAQSSSQNAFQCGPSVQPCTQGIWICTESILIGNETHSTPFRLIFMDTEGMGSFKASETHDAQIFALALLLSSFFIYNSSHTIDDNAINRLGLVTQLSQYIQSTPKTDAHPTLGRSPSKRALSQSLASSALASQLPFFLWVVRDFSLQLHGTSGERINASEYLEMALSVTNENDSAKNMEKKHSVKQMIQDYFVDRDCFTLVRPVNEEEKLQHLSSLSKYELRTEFSREMNNLANYIYTHVAPKRLHNQVLNGRQFVLLCQQYCESLNKGSIVIDSCWENVVRSEAERLISECRALYQREIKQIVAQGTILSLDEFQQLHLEAEKKAMQHFFKKLPNSFKNDKSLYQNDLKNQLDYDYQYYKEKLKKASNHYCIKLINDQLNILDAKLKSNHYLKDESMDQFQRDVKNMIQEYQDNASGSEKDTVLLEALLTWLLPSTCSLHQMHMHRLKEDSQEEQKQIVTEHITNLDYLKQQYQFEQDNLQQKLNALNDSYQKQIAQHQKLQDDLHLKSQLVDEQESTISILQSDISTRKQENQALQSKIEALHEELDESLKTISDLKKQLRDIKSSDNDTQEELYSIRISNQTLKIENESHLQTIEFLEQKNNQLSIQTVDLTKELNSAKRQHEESQSALADANQLLEQSKQLLRTTEQDKDAMSKKRKRLEEKLLEYRNQIQDLENKIRQHELVIMNKNSHIRSFEREMEYEREKALENEDRLRHSLKEKERLLAQDKTLMLERQVEQLNATNRRILEINKNVMEENNLLREELSKFGVGDSTKTRALGHIGFQAEERNGGDERRKSRNGVAGNLSQLVSTHTRR